MSTGEKIKRYRKMRHLTQDELGERVGVTGNAIRNYEHDFRSPNAEQLEKIADALEVPASALEEYKLETVRDAMEALFRLEDAYGLAPAPDGTLTIHPRSKGSHKLSQAIKNWNRIKEQVASGEMSEDTYELWKASFTG